jgi:hypothetical protein
MIASSIPPHFWVEVVSTSTYIWLTFSLSRPFREVFLLSIFVARRQSTLAFIFFVVGAMCLHLMSALGWLHSLLSVCFLGYSAEHKRYRYWNSVDHRMQTSPDVVFDESSLFYPCPSSDVSHVSSFFPTFPRCSFRSFAYLSSDFTFFDIVFCVFLWVILCGSKLHGEASSDIDL